MNEVSIIGLDIAKQVFQAHAADSRGNALFSKKITRSKLLCFFASQPPCLVAMEACGGAHHWGRELSRLGHEVRLIPPAYVKPFVKRQKSDALDAEAISEAAQRPGMRFVAVKSEAQQANAMLFKTRDLFVRQRTQIVNALRGHMAEFGWVAPKGLKHARDLQTLIADPACELLPAARAMLKAMLETLDALDSQISDLDQQITRRAREDEVARKLMTIPGIGSITAVAIAALAPPPEGFARGRDFAAWLGLTPRQRSTGGKQRLGSITKMGERTLRRLLIIGSTAVVRQARRWGTDKNPWLTQMLGRKPPMLVAVALANKIARIVWAVMTRNEEYRAPAAAT